MLTIDEKAAITVLVSVRLGASVCRWDGDSALVMWDRDDDDLHTETASSLLRVIADLLAPDADGYGNGEGEGFGDAEDCRGGSGAGGVNSTDGCIRDLFGVAT